MNAMLCICLEGAGLGGVIPNSDLRYYESIAYGPYEVYFPPNLLTPCEMSVAAGLDMLSGTPMKERALGI